MANFGNRADQAIEPINWDRRRLDLYSRSLAAGIIHQCEEYIARRASYCDDIGHDQWIESIYRGCRETLGRQDEHIAALMDRMAEMARLQAVLQPPKPILLSVPPLKGWRLKVRELGWKLIRWAQGGSIGEPVV